MGAEKWRDVPVSTNATLERILPDDLPLLINRSNKLDNKIASFFQNDNCPPVQWLIHPDKLIIIDLPSEYKEAYEIEAEIEGTSTGYFDPGCTSGPADNWYPPEQEDEREITNLTLVIYDIDGNELGKYVPDDLSRFDELEKLLYEEDIDTNEW